VRRHAEHVRAVEAEGRRAGARVRVGREALIDPAEHDADAPGLDAERAMSSERENSDTVTT
jgi:hypothetical protein